MKTNKTLSKRQIVCLSNKVLNFQSYLSDVITDFPSELDMSDEQMHFCNDLYAVIGTIEQLVEDYNLSDTSSFDDIVYLLRN